MQSGGGGYGGGSGGSGGGAWVPKSDFKLTPSCNTNKTKGWKEYNSEGIPPHHTRERTNLGGYYWMHGFNPWGLGHNSKKNQVKEGWPCMFGDKEQPAWRCSISEDNRPQLMMRARAN